MKTTIPMIPCCLCLLLLLRPLGAETSYCMLTFNAKSNTVSFYLNAGFYHENCVSNCVCLTVCVRVHSAGPGRWGRGSTSATSPAVRRRSGKRRCSELTCGCTPARGPSSATGFSVGNVSHAATSCSDTPGRTQVCLPKHTWKISDMLHHEESGFQNGTKVLECSTQRKDGYLMNKCVCELQNTRCNTKKAVWCIF